MTTETKNSSFPRKIGQVFGAASFLISFYASINAYFIRSVDASTNIIYDGFGRQLEIIPLFIRMIFTTDSLWPGFMWSALDTVIILSTWAIGYFLIFRED